VSIQAGRLRPLKQTQLSTHGVLQIYRLFTSLIVRAWLWFVALIACSIPLLIRTQYGFKHC
jgi:hypothetical protein